MKIYTQNHTILFLQWDYCYRLYLLKSVGLLVFSDVQNVIASDQYFSQLSLALTVYNFLSICQLNYKL